MKLKYEFVMTEIDDRTVAIPVGEMAEDFNGIIHLNGTAKEIMEQLSVDTTSEEIIEKLAEKYSESSREEIGAAVNGFVESLKKENLLVD